MTAVPVVNAPAAVEDAPVPAVNAPPPVEHAPAAVPAGPAEPAAAPRRIPAVPVPQVPVPKRDPLWYAPLFVLSPARSYSSVVTTMISQHPQLFGFPELSLLRTQTVRQLLTDPPNWRGIPAMVKQAGLFRALAQLHAGEQTPETVGAAARWLRQRGDWNTIDVYDHLLESVAPQIGVEKSPETVSRMSHLERLAAAYPRARFVHLVRHPVTTQRSMVKAWKDRKYWDVEPELFGQFCLGVWYYQHRRVMDFTSRFPPDRVYRLRAEDVLNSPYKALGSLCGWLGVDRSRSAIAPMTHPEQGVFARQGPHGAVGGNDPGFLRNPQRQRANLPRTVEFSAEWRIDPWAAVAAIELAAELGYGRIAPAAQSTDP